MVRRLGVDVPDEMKLIKSVSKSLFDQWNKQKKMFNAPGSVRDEPFDLGTHTSRETITVKKYVAEFAIFFCLSDRALLLRVGFNTVAASFSLARAIGSKRDSWCLNVIICSGVWMLILRLTIAMFVPFLTSPYFKTTL